MPWGFAAAAVGTIAGAAISGSAAKSAANTQATVGCKRAADLEQRIQHHNPARTAVHECWVWGAL